MIACAKLAAAAAELKAAVAARISAEVASAEARGRLREIEGIAYDCFPGQWQAETAPARRAAARMDGPLLAALRGEIYAEQRYRSALHEVAADGIVDICRPATIPCSCSACSRATREAL